MGGEGSYVVTRKLIRLWFKYVHMEEMLGNVGCARRIF